MTSLIAAVLFMLLIAHAAEAGVFIVDFEDVNLNSGIGFDDPSPVPLHNCGATTLGELRQCTALNALNDLGALINFASGPDILFLTSSVSGPDPAGAASAFYHATLLGNPQGGFLHQHVTTSVDSSPGHDANIKINFADTVLNGILSPMNSDYEVIDQSMVDLYTVVLHEAIHALGIASLINSMGQSALSLSTSGPFSLFDEFLVLGGTSTTLLSTGSFTASPGDLTSNGIEYLEATNTVARLPVLSAAPFAPGGSLSHFDRFRDAADVVNIPYTSLVFDWVMGSGKPVRGVTNPEQDVLCNLGYDLGPVCSTGFPIGHDDVGPSTNPGATVCVSVLVNDFDPDGDTLAIDVGCGVTIQNGNGPGSSAVASFNQVCYTPPAGFVGTASVFYCPTDGVRVGNPTQVTFEVEGTSCPNDPCNLICNGGFEDGVPVNTWIGFGAMANCPSMVDNWCSTIGSPDYYVRDYPFGVVNKIPDGLFAANGCPPGVDTWDWSGTPNGNDRYIGMIYHGQPSNEGIYTKLIQPLVPGQTYQLSFHAITINSGGTFIVPGELQLGFTTAQPVANIYGGATNSPLDFALPQQTTTLCGSGNDGTNYWGIISLTFIAPATPGLNYFIIEPVVTPQQVPLLDEYIYIDDFRLEEDGALISVTKAVDNSSPMIGNTITYSIEVCNQGSGTASGVVIDDQLPPGLVAIGGSFSYPSHTLSSPILAGGCQTLTLVVEVTPSAVAGIPLTNCASVVAGGTSCASTGDHCVDILIREEGSIGGTKWHDLDGDSVKDPGEPGVAGWTIILTDASGASTTIMTDGSGNYVFSNIPPGNYVVSEGSASGWAQTYPSMGSHAILLSPGLSLNGVNFGNQQMEHGWLVDLRRSDRSGCARRPDFRQRRQPHERTVGCGRQSLERIAL